MGRFLCSFCDSRTQRLYLCVDSTAPSLDILLFAINLINQYHSSHSYQAWNSIFERIWPFSFCKVAKGDFLSLSLLENLKLFLVCGKVLYGTLKAKKIRGNIHYVYIHCRPWHLWKEKDFKSFTKNSGGGGFGFRLFTKRYIGSQSVNIGAEQDQHFSR